jgi:hypothetical protein
MKKSKNLLIVLLVSLLVGVVYYQYVAVKKSPEIYTASNLIYLPSNNYNNTFLFSNKSPQEWSSLSEINAKDNEEVKKDPKKVEQFKVVYSPSISSFMANYYSSMVVQNSLMNKFGKKIDTLTMIEPLYKIGDFGNGYINLEANLNTEKDAKEFINDLNLKQKELVTQLNLTRADNEKYTFDQKPISNITKVDQKVVRSPINFIASAIFTFVILIFILIKLNKFD